MIAKSTVDQVYETARVEEVIGDFVSLKKSGANYKGLSPFSQERTPSFMVSPVKQIWKDFSSGKGGNVVAFLMEHEHFSYPEAIRYLAGKYGIEIVETERTDEEKEKANERESLYLVSQFAKETFEDNLWNTTSGKSIGLSYFRERGFTDETVKHFALGYSPEAKYAFYKKAKKAGYAPEYLKKTGLCILSENGAIDRFRSRVMFPIRSMAGRVQGFGGRALSKYAKTAKYLNSPESEIYHKSKVIYGIYEAKKSIAQEDVCYIVEGYTDVIQMYQSGIENVVSSSGTALSVEQIQTIRRLTSNIIVLFDSDAAGLRAAIRGIDLILEQGMNVRVCLLPEGDDPDSFARKNSDIDIRNFIVENTKDFIQFKTSLLIEDSEGDPIKKSLTIREIISSISKIPDPIQQEIYVQQCAKLMEVSEAVLFNALSQEGHKKTRSVQRRVQPEREMAKVEETTSEAENPMLNLEKQIVSILLRYGQYEAQFDEVLLSVDEEGNLVETSKIISAKVYEKVFLDLQQDEVAFIHPIYQRLYSQLIELYQIENTVKPERIIQQSNRELGQIISDILLAEERYQLHGWEKKSIYVKDRKSVIGQLVSETILTLRKCLIDQKIQSLIGGARDQPAETDNSELLEEIKNYQQLKVVLSKKLSRVL